MKVLLSIKPQFAEQIFNGIKKFEFRRQLFSNPNVTTVVVYASSPLKQVIGEFEIDSIINDQIPNLWNITKDLSGISEEYFYKYFQQKDRGFAIKIKSPKLYSTPLSIKDDFNLSPPQSFVYLT